MKIGGLQPVTLLDYPEKVAAIIFTAGCNMRCPFCYNAKLVLPELIRPENLYNEADILAFLKKRKKYLDGVVITGGEPTLQPDLPEFLAKLKKMGYEIKLDTNGLWPEEVEKVIKEGLVDYIAMDIKGPLDNYEKFSGVAGGAISDSINLIMASGLPYEFRSTLVKGLHQPGDIAPMAEAISGAGLYYLQNYSGEKPLAGEKLKGRGFTEAELEKFAKEAGKFVKACLVR